MKQNSVRIHQGRSQLFGNGEHLAEGRMGRSPRLIPRFKGFLDAPRASHNVQFYCSSGRKNIKNSEK